MDETEIEAKIEFRREQIRLYGSKVERMQEHIDDLTKRATKFQREIDMLERQLECEHPHYRRVTRTRATCRECGHEVRVR